MIDREKVLTVLCRRFPKAPPTELAAAANAIVGLPDEWDDVTLLEPDLLSHLAHSCGDDCVLAAHADGNFEFRLFRRPAR